MRVTRLTSTTRSAHHPHVTEKDVIGGESPNGAAMSRNVHALRLFCRLGASSYGRPGGGSRKARRCSIGLSTSVSVAHPFESGLAVIYRKLEHMPMARTSRLIVHEDSNIVDLLPVGKPKAESPHYSILDTPTDKNLVNAAHLNDLINDIREAVGHLRHHPHAHRSVQNFVARQLGTQHLRNLPIAKHEAARELIKKLRGVFIAHSVNLWSLEQRFLRDILEDSQEAS